MKICIDIQHNGKPDKEDWGAKDPFDFDEHEVWWTLQYGAALALSLKEFGHSVFVISAGSYRQRAEYMNQMNLDLALCCHVNMMPESARGEGEAGKLFYDHRTSEAHLKKIYKAAKLLTENLPWPTNTQPSSPDDWTADAYNVQKYYKCWTLCLEPFFLDHKKTRDVLEHYGPQWLGEEIARAIDEGYK